MRLGIVTLGVWRKWGANMKPLPHRRGFVVCGKMLDLPGQGVEGRGCSPFAFLVMPG